MKASTVQLLQKIVKKLIAEEVEKAKVSIRKEMYLAINEASIQGKPTINTQSRTKSTSQTAAPISRSSIFEALDMSLDDLNPAIAQGEDYSTSVIDPIPSGTQLKPAVQQVVDILNSPDLAKKAKAMEEAARRNR